MGTVWLLLRVLLSLTLVLGLLWLAARGLRSSQRVGSGVALDVLARQPLTQRSSVAVVRVGERALVLGVSDSRVDLLREVALTEVLEVADEPVAAGSTAVVARRTAGPLAGSALAPATWARALDAVRSRTVRR